MVVHRFTLFRSTQVLGGALGLVSSTYTMQVVYIDVYIGPVEVYIGPVHAKLELSCTCGRAKRMHILVERMCMCYIHSTNFPSKN